MSDYGDTLEAEMLADYVSGGTPLVDACALLGLNVRTINRRRKKYQKFGEMMGLARDVGHDVMAANARKVARGVEGFSSGDVKRDRLIVDTDMKLLAKWDPRRYGEKIEIEQKSASVAIPVGNDPIAATRAYEQLLKGG